MFGIFGDDLESALGFPLLNMAVNLGMNVARRCHRSVWKQHLGWSSKTPHTQTHNAQVPGKMDEKGTNHPSFLRSLSGPSNL